MWLLTKAMADMKLEHWTKGWNWSSSIKLVLSVSWAYGLIAQLIRTLEQNWVVLCWHPTQATFCTYFQNSSVVNTLWISSFRCTLVTTCAGFCSKKNFWLTKSMAEMKREHWTKRWNWSGCKRLALSASWAHVLIAQSVRDSKRNSVLAGLNPTQSNFLY